MSIREIWANVKFPSRNSPKKDPGGDQTAVSLTTDLLEFSEKTQGRGKSLNAEILGRKPAGWAIDVLKQRGLLGVLKKDRNDLMDDVDEVAVPKWAVWKWPSRNSR